MALRKDADVSLSKYMHLSICEYVFITTKTIGSGNEEKTELTIVYATCRRAHTHRLVRTSPRQPLCAARPAGATLSHLYPRIGETTDLWRFYFRVSVLGYIGEETTNGQRVVSREPLTARRDDTVSRATQSSSAAVEKILVDLGNVNSSRECL